MAEPSDLKALYALIYEAKTTIETVKLPQNRGARAVELLTAALALTDELTKERPAAALGARGGAKTAQRGPEYFARVAAMQMITTGCCSIKQALVDHLLSRIEVQQVRDMCIATLPISTLDRRLVDVFIEPRAADYFLVHDGGKAVNELILQGMRITDSVTRGFQMTASRLGVSYADEMFQSGTKIENLPSVVNKVGMCSALAMTNLLPCSQNAASHASDGGQDHGSCLDAGGITQRGVISDKYIRKDG